MHAGGVTRRPDPAISRRFKTRETALYALAFLLWAVLVTGVAWLAGRSARPAIAADPRCGGCGYPISALRPGSGRLVCPECGRADDS